MRKKAKRNKVDSLLGSIRTAKGSASGQEWKALHKAESTLMYETGRLKHRKNRTKRDLEKKIKDLENVKVPKKAKRKKKAEA